MDDWSEIEYLTEKDLPYFRKKSGKRRGRDSGNPAGDPAQHGYQELAGRRMNLLPGTVSGSKGMIWPADVLHIWYAGGPSFICQTALVFLL